MSAMERVAKAIVGADAEWWDRISANHGSGRGVPDQGVMQAAAALAAVVPYGSEAVIVLRGGDVVGLEAVVTELVLDTGVGVSTEELLDAAIQAAEGEA